MGLAFHRLISPARAERGLQVAGPVRSQGDSRDRGERMLMREVARSGLVLNYFDGKTKRLADGLEQGRKKSCQGILSRTAKFNGL